MESVRKFKNLIKNILYSINEIRFHKINVNNIQNQKDCISIVKTNVKGVKNIPVNLNTNGKWVGSVIYENYMYCIPNRVNKFLKIDLKNDKISYINFDYENTNEFLWTGGCVYKDIVYGFTRYSNKLVRLNTKNDKVDFIDLNISYNREHHYGGVCTPKGIVYQPPRCNNTILVIDLNNYSSKEIAISPKWLKYDYATGIVGSNGLIYFMPSNKGKIMVVDPTSEKVYFIGKRLKISVFGPCLGTDNNIYGFSSYAKGILKLDTKKNKVKMIHKELGCPGAYGNKLGINGKIYNIPGNGKYIYEFDYINDKVKKIINLGEGFAKCAGGSVSYDGSIYAVPAFGDKIYKIEFKTNKTITEKVLKSIYYSDNY